MDNSAPAGATQPQPPLEVACEKLPPEVLGSGVVLLQDAQHPLADALQDLADPHRCVCSVWLPLPLSLALLLAHPPCWYGNISNTPRSSAPLFSAMEKSASVAQQCD
jgi:hypothetical protein